MKGWSDAFSVSYTGSGVQLITIHRAAGTAYTETVGTYTVWHLYVGTTGCKTDYADIRFTTPAGADITHYRRPGYTSSVGTFEVILPVTGPIRVWYGNPSATTASAGATIIPGITSFTNTGSTTYTVPAGGTSVEVLVVAGGGGGGNIDGYGGCGGGGGGGGGVIHSTISVAPDSTHSVLVGGGGSTGQSGGNSKFGDLTAIGGGRGGAGSTYGNGGAGGAGGSGGGGGSAGIAGGGSGGAGGAGTPGQGTNGSPGGRSSSKGGSGGGLNYVSDITGTQTTYGIGGSGGSGGKGIGGSGFAAASGSTGGGGGVVVKPLLASGNLISVDPVSFMTSFTGIAFGSTNAMVI